MNRGTRGLANDGNTTCSRFNTRPTSPRSANVGNGLRRKRIRSGSLLDAWRRFMCFITNFLRFTSLMIFTSVNLSGTCDTSIFLSAYIRIIVFARCNLGVCHYFSRSGSRATSRRSGDSGMSTYGLYISGGYRSRNASRANQYANARAGSRLVNILRINRVDNGANSRTNDTMFISIKGEGNLSVNMRNFSRISNGTYKN